MSSDKRLGKKLPERVRREDTPGVRIDSGPFIGIIKNNDDPTRSGRVQVWIPDLGGQQDDPKNWRTVRYASPFYGTTYQPDASKNNKFDEVQHSYGMWAVVPDLGNQVICTFIAGNADRGYWFACINPNLSHHMVPAMGTGNYVDNENTNPALKGKYDPKSSKWPVAEFNQNVEQNVSAGWVNNPKPVHEFQANVLINQGLDKDGTRGAIGSSSQRESPSMVFGISTPGRPVKDPFDNPALLSRMKAGLVGEDELAVRGRKGGHTFVMDDGDQEGNNQLFRLRTAGGHQILMNDTERVMYIANSDGSVWMEFTGGGFINMYSAKGINMRTEGEFNIHADKDINLNSGGTIKMKAEGGISSQTATFNVKATTAFNVHAGKLNLLSVGALNLQGSSIGANSEGKLILKGSKVLLNTETPANIPSVPDLKVYAQADTTWDSAAGVWKSVSDVYETIATTSPAHEPWPRGAGKGVAGAGSQFAAAPQNEKQSSVCAPPGAPAGLGTSIGSISPTGSNNEALLESALTGYGITDTIKFANIMAQCAHESGNFKFLKELGEDSYFAKYEGRADLGNTQPGDGVKFKGRGFIQITGRDIYNKAGKYLGVDLINQPELAEDPATAAKLVLFFFFEYKKGRTSNVDWADITAVTRIVNGGTNGLSDRIAKFDQYKQKYAAGIIQTGSGGVLVDSSGVPIQSGSSKLDPGIEAAKGKTVENAAPAEMMKREDAPSPGAITSDNTKIPGLIPTQMKALMVQIGFAESGLDYAARDTAKGRLGRYKFNPQMLRVQGYIKSDYVRKYKEMSVFRDDAYTGKDGITGVDAFLAAKGTQDTLMETILKDFYTRLVRTQGIKIDDDVCTVGGMLSAAYFYRDNDALIGDYGPTDQAKFWREQAGNPDPYGKTGEAAYNQGRYAIDILSVAVAGGVGNIPPYEAPTVDINPDDVLVFTNRSGDRAHFNAATVDFRDRLLSAAKEYKEKTGKNLTISSTVRTQDEQNQIYEGWIAAGGQLPNNPTVNVNPYGNISRPVKIVGNHGLGIAADVGVLEAAEMDSLGILAKFGLYLFDPIGDPPHIQLKPELRPANLTTIQSLGSNNAG